MNDAVIMFFLIIIILLLSCIALYQQFVFRTDIQRKLKKISKELETILNADSDEKVMVFTENRILIALATQINRLLEDRQKTNVNFRRSEISSKKMLSNVSHDIKTPMTVMLGYLEIMRLKNYSDEMLVKVESKAQQVMELVNQFFTLAKLEAGDTDMELSKISINEVCRESILDFYEMLVQKDFKVDIKIPETAIYTIGNQEAIRRVLSNLITNAIRYGADGKYLGIFLRADEKVVCVDVTDKGKGIDPAFANTVFERLFTLEDSRNRDIQGNGLGLTIAKRLAQQMDGNVTLESIPFVKTTFTLELKKIVY